MITVATHSLIGKRKENQDRVGFVADEHRVVVALADGVGGSLGGAEAATIAIDTVLAHARGWTGRRRAQEFLADAIIAANEAVRGAQKDHLREMATTIVAFACFAERRAEAAVAHVGDSRAYLINGRAGRRLTDDHQVGGRLLSWLGMPRSDLAIGYRGVLVGARKMIVLTSDGINPVPLQALIDGARGPIETAAHGLAQNAIDRGGTDNATVAIISF